MSDISPGKHRAPLEQAALKEADDAFGRQISGQVARITGELNRLDQLLSAGQVDKQVLSEFRYAVDRIRQTGWEVQTWLEGDERALSTLLTEQRVRVATRLANHLASELEVEAQTTSATAPLKEAIAKLHAVLRDK